MRRNTAIATVSGFLAGIAVGLAMPRPAPAVDIPDLQAGENVGRRQVLILTIEHAPGLRTPSTNHRAAEDGRLTVNYFFRDEAAAKRASDAALDAAFREAMNVAR